MCMLVGSGCLCVSVLMVDGIVFIRVSGCCVVVWCRVSVLLFSIIVLLVISGRNSLYMDRLKYIEV